MNMTKQRIALLGMIGVFALTGCASTKQLVPRPSGESITSGKTQVHIRRPGQIWGTANAFKVLDGAKEIGSLGPRGDLLWEREPGELKLSVGPKIFNMGNFTPIEMNLKEGERHEFEAWFPFFYPFSHHGLDYTGERRSDK